MSLNGSINKVSGDIRRAIQTIAKSSLTGLDGSVIGTEKISGYVCAINEDGEYAGTVDVQEFFYEAGEYETEGAGHHKGVLLSAIQDNAEGIKIVPMLFSEVVIVRNPRDGQEYVLMYSHAQRIQLNAHSTEGSGEGEVKIGVTEVEKFVETDEGLDKDYDELEPTKNASTTTYSSESIKDQVTSKQDNDGFTQEMTAKQKTITVGDTKITIDGENVTIETSKQIRIKGSNNVTINSSNVKITGGKLTVQGMSNTDLNGPFNAIKACPFSGAPHCGSQVSGT